ncbi:MAG: tyrosine-type recombinase/integrase [Bacillota bacterium]
MASIEKRGENTYRITVSSGYDSNGKKIRKHKSVTLDPHLTPKQIEKELNKLSVEFERQVETGQALDGNITLNTFVMRWIEEYASKQLQPKTLSSYQAELNSKILPALGHLRMDKIQPIHLLSFYNNLFEDGVRIDGKPGSYSNRTVKYQHQILSSLFQSAVYWQVMMSNPCERVKPPKKDIVSEKVKHFDENQAIIFLEEIRNEEIKYQAAVNVTIYGGLRKGELLGLTWDDIKFDQCTIRINKANQYLTDTGIFTKTPKNKTSIRTISMPKNVITLLNEYKLWQEWQRKQCGDQWEDNNLVFTQWNGKPMSYDTPYQWFKKFLKRYNERIQNDKSIPEDEKAKYLLPEISFHGLRHTSATLLIAEKMDVKTVSARLGHAQTSTTLNIYSHSVKSADEKAASTLENLLDKKKNVTDLKQA